jgi:alkanesulfonate monooxygenase SsuD/methylene tetrahydromethanopterin reductase-like flavin-dependent oxidoreductase (luciferase family)
MPAQEPQGAIVPPLKIGFGVPRGIGDPSRFGRPDHKIGLKYAQRAEQLGFDSVWVPDHYFFERPAGVLTPYPEAWTLMTAIGATTSRVQIGSMVMAAGFRPPALVAHMADAFQDLFDNRLILGLGAGNQIAEHTAFGIDFERRVGRFAEYLKILTALMAGETISVESRHHTLREATLRIQPRRAPILIAAGGERMLDLTAQYADAWNPAGGGGEQGFKTRLAALHEAMRKHGRDPSQMEITASATVVVAPDKKTADGYVQTLMQIPPGGTEEQIRASFVVGTPDEVAATLRQRVEWGASHLILGIGGQPFSIWSEEMLELFGREVMPRLRGGR